MSANTNVNSYTPDGRIKQVEYAMKAMNLGTTSIALKLDEMVILVSEKKITSPLQISSSITKHFKIYDKILMGCSGIITDAPTIIEKCRKICLDHDITYDEQIPIEKLMDSLCYLALQFSNDDFDKKIYSRPFGVSMIIASYEIDGPRLYCIDPSGSFVPYNACSVGSAYEVVTSELKKHNFNRYDKDSAIKELLRILKNAMKDKMTSENIEVSIVGSTGVRHYSTEELQHFME